MKPLDRTGIPEMSIMDEEGGKQYVGWIEVYNRARGAD